MASSKSTDSTSSKTDRKFIEQSYCLGLDLIYSEYDLSACFRSAVSKVREILTDRLLGRLVPKTEEEAAADQKLLDGELFYPVPPGYQIHMHAQPQVVFKPRRLILDDESAGWYSVTDIKVGKNSLFASAAALPGFAFKSGCLSQLSMDTCQISMYITVSLRNVSGKVRRVPRAMLEGISGRFEADPLIPSPRW